MIGDTTGEIAIHLAEIKSEKERFLQGKEKGAAPVQGKISTGFKQGKKISVQQVSHPQKEKEENFLKKREEACLQRRARG